MRLLIRLQIPLQPWIQAPARWRIAEPQHLLAALHRQQDYAVRHWLHVVKLLTIDLTVPGLQLQPGLKLKLWQVRHQHRMAPWQAVAVAAAMVKTSPVLLLLRPHQANSRRVGRYARMYAEKHLATAVAQFHWQEGMRCHRAARLQSAARA